MKLNPLYMYEKFIEKNKYIHDNNMLENDFLYLY